MRQPTTCCLDCWVVWIERNLSTEIRGSNKQFAKQETRKVTEAVKERSIDEIVADDPYADLIRGT